MRKELPIELEACSCTWSTAFAKRLAEKFLPSYSVEHTSLNIFSWNPLTRDCQGSYQFMTFALFTTLLRRVRLSQVNRWLFGVFILALRMPTQE
jgi:hypothetical protein